MKKTLPITVTAHSGCLSQPDNSLESMAAGVKLGAEIVEFDLRFDPIGTPILSHNTPKKKAVTLAAAFAFLAEHPGVQANIDVKDLSGLAQVYPLAEEYGVADRLFYTGITAVDAPVVRDRSPEIPFYLNTKVEKDPDAPRDVQPGAVYAALVNKAKALGAVGINLRLSRLTPMLLTMCHAAGLEVSVFTVNRPRKIAKAVRLRPDNITTRRPDLVLAAMRSPEYD